MNFHFKNRPRTTAMIAILSFAVFAEALLIAKLYSDRENRPYEVNLVKINSEKDTIDYLKMRCDLLLMDNEVRKIHSFLASKNIQDSTMAQLAKDSLSNAVYLAKQNNRYSQYLAELEQKLQTVPLGMPTDGYISSNFGNRKNPIPFKVKPTATEQKATVKPDAPPKVIEEKDSLGNVIKRTEIPQKTLAKNIAKTPVRDANNPPAEADQIQFHKGLDIAVAYGSDVKCTAAGTVIWAGPKGGYGNCVIVSHSNGLATLYGHLSQILVKVNERVNVGQIIAKSGNTGRSTGPHLHYEVHRDGTPVNPKLFLNF